MRHHGDIFDYSITLLVGLFDLLCGKLHVVPEVAVVRRATRVSTQSVRKKFGDAVCPPVLFGKRAEELEGGDHQAACFFHRSLSVRGDAEERGGTESGLLGGRLLKSNNLHLVRG